MNIKLEFERLRITLIDAEPAGRRVRRYGIPSQEPPNGHCFKSVPTR